MTEVKEISNIEVNPNCLRSYTKVPLPDFAIAALKKDGFTYDFEPSSFSQSQLELQQQGKQCKLTKHLQSIKSHIDKDGPRIWDVRSGGGNGDSLDSKSTAGGSL